jgi:3-hydroxyacyl-CoA dehydrogenase/enoyl-CoA hydratase/3-hydroxybutyryl-CoA epimerase
MAIFQAETLVVERATDGSVMLRLDVPGRTYNVITRQVLTEMNAALDALAEESRVPPLLVVCSGKKTGFLAGADVRGFLEIEDAASAQALSAQGQQLFDRLAALPFPTLASISGPCLGGGLELALACDYRLVFDRPDTQLGFPEVTLGLLPAWGGTQRLPRVVGLERALEMILRGKRLRARQAFSWGLAHALAHSETELRQQFTRLCGQAVIQGKVERKGLPLRTWRQRLLESTSLGRRVILRLAQRVMNRRVPEDMPAPGEALEAVRVGVSQGMEAGLLQEREAAARLALTHACRNLIGLFLAQERARKLPEHLAQVHPPEVRRVGVVGAGVMGAGIAQLAALKGFQVTIQEVNQAALEAGLERISALFQKALEHRLLTEVEVARQRSAIEGTLSWEYFDEVDLVIEAAVEDLEIKKSLFQELDRRTRSNTVLATNTSSLSVSALAEAVEHPERLAGLHFFNPVHKMPLIEVARTERSNEATIALLTQWAISLGKVPVIVKDSPGFVVNRILMPYLNEAVLLVSEGMTVDEVDRVMKRFGMPMGPLELLDQVGLDVAAHVARSMTPVLAERFPLSPAFQLLCERGWLGSKSGKGFYTHQRGKKAVHKEAQTLIQSSANLPPRDLPEVARRHEARERMVLLMVNEAALALREGLTASAADLDLAMILGTGWAPHRGGPLTYAEQRGHSEVIQALESLASQHGNRFTPLFR